MKELAWKILRIPDRSGYLKASNNKRPKIEDHRYGQNKQSNANETSKLVLVNNLPLGKTSTQVDRTDSAEKPNTTNLAYKMYSFTWYTGAEAHVVNVKLLMCVSTDLLA